MILLSGQSQPSEEERISALFDILDFESKGVIHADEMV